MWPKGDTEQQTGHFAVCGEVSRQGFTGAVGIKWSGLVPSKEHNLSTGKTCKIRKQISLDPNLKFLVLAKLSLKLITADGAHFLSQSVPNHLAWFQ